MSAGTLSPTATKQIGSEETHQQNAEPTNREQEQEHTQHAAEAQSRTLKQKKPTEETV